MLHKLKVMALRKVQSDYADSTARSAHNNWNNHLSTILCIPTETSLFEVMYCRYVFIIQVSRLWSLVISKALLPMEMASLDERCNDKEHV